MTSNDPMLIYNLFPLLAGPFPKWETHLERAASMKFTWVFVNPIQVPGSSGSIYSIFDYRTLNPALVAEGPQSAETQLKKAIAQGRELGLKFMVDLVINHCSTDSKLIKTHPDMFVWRGNEVEHPGAQEDGHWVSWEDLARFDHSKAREGKGPLYEYYLDTLKYLLELGFTGFRCDAAYQLPSELWRRLIQDVRSIDPDVKFLAETLGCTPEQTRQTAKAGFDYIFNSSKWWDFTQPWLMKQYHLTRDLAPSVSFPETHDTSRLAEELNGNIAGLKQRYLFASVFSGGVMAPIGFEYGFRRRLHVVKTTPADWEETEIDLTEFIEACNEMVLAHPVFQEDAVTETIHHDNPNILFMWKGSTNSHEDALVILNKDIHNKQGFWAESLLDYTVSKEPLNDVSPEFRLDFVPAPFHYELRPGQAIILVNEREPVEKG